MTQLHDPISLHRNLEGPEIETDQCCFFREYCKELKLSLNNTQFLLDFSQYIDRNTPDTCESCIFFTWHTRIGCDVLFALCEHYNTTDLHNVNQINKQSVAVLCALLWEFMCVHARCVLLLVIVESSTPISRWSASEGQNMIIGHLISTI